MMTFKRNGPITLVYYMNFKEDYNRHWEKCIKQNAVRIDPIRRLRKPVYTPPRIPYYQLGPFCAKSTT